MKRYYKKIKEYFAYTKQKCNAIYTSAKAMNWIDARYYKRYGIVILILIGILSFAMFYHSDKSAVMVCESSLEYNAGIGLSFVLDKDGKTITKIIKKDTVTPAFIENNLKDTNVEAAMNAYKENISTVYEDIVNKYKDITWFDAKLNVKDNKIETIYTFDVGSKEFQYHKAKELLESFSLEYYYNDKENKFLYDEETFLNKEKTPLGTIPKVKCKQKE